MGMQRMIMAIRQALLALLVAGAVSPALAQGGAKQPNIILILADDLGYGDLSINGSTLLKTPEIDRLAREGAMLSHFFSSANVCTPSRAGLLTGRYAARMGLAQGVIFPHSDYGLPAGEVTLAEALKEQGYRTHMVGKWHLGTVEGSWPTDQGFESYFGVPYSNDMVPLPLMRNRETLEEPAAQDELIGRFTDAALEVIEQAGDHPYFLYVAHTAPHIPLAPGEGFAGRSQAGRYGDVVEELDASVGRLRAAVERSGKARDTLILFTSDNGPWFQGSSGPYRDRKGGTYEGAYSVPLVAWQPGTIPAGARSDAIAMNTDLFTTLLRRAGGTPPTDRPIDGKDIWPLLQGGRTTPHDALLFFSNNKIAAIRTQGWRYVVRSFYLTFDVDLEPRGGSMLFDTVADPAETYDVSDRNPGVVEVLRQWAEYARRELESIPQNRTGPAPASR